MDAGCVHDASENMLEMRGSICVYNAVKCSLDEGDKCCPLNQQQLNRSFNLNTFCMCVVCVCGNFYVRYIWVTICSIGDWLFDFYFPIYKYILLCYINWVHGTKKNIKYYYIVVMWLHRFDILRYGRMDLVYFFYVVA